MTVEVLANMLKLDPEVIAAVADCGEQIKYDEISSSCEKLLVSSRWEEGVRELQEYCGEDPQGMKILAINLHCLTGTYQRYMEKGISEKIFLDTMGFIPRFIKSHKEVWGVSAFTWAWWFPRQLSMNEFRVGEYEYEFLATDEGKKLNLHIPADADLAAGDIGMIYPFVREFYPEYEYAPIVCDSWLLSPALKELLPEDSNIIRFQDQFEVQSIDWDSPWFMDWVFARHDIPLEELPEHSLLQRNMKKHLLDGKKVGCAYGVWKACGR